MQVAENGRQRRSQSRLSLRRTPGVLLTHVGSLRPCWAIVLSNLLLSHGALTITRQFHAHPSADHSRSPMLTNTLLHR